jgi:hypothetical protein
MNKTQEYYSKLAKSIKWIKDVNEDFYDQADQELEELKKFLPYGSGFNSGSEICLEECQDEKIVILTWYHHMNERGYREEVTKHKVIITPSFRGMNIKVTGKNKNIIKVYIADLFYNLI